MYYLRRTSEEKKEMPTCSDSESEYHWEILDFAPRSLHLHSLRAGRTGFQVVADSAKAPLKIRKKTAPSLPPEFASLVFTFVFLSLRFVVRLRASEPCASGARIGFRPMEPLDADLSAETTWAPMDC